MAQKRRNYRKKKGYSTYWLIPLFFIIAVVPLWMRGTVVELSELEQSVWINQETRFDVFSYWKSIWFVLATLLSTGIMAWLHLDKKIEIKWPLWLVIPIGIYLFFTLLSFLNAPDLSLAARGFIEIFQGVFVMMSYGIIIFVSMNLFRREEDLLVLIKWFLFIWTAVFFIGFSQYFGFDVFRWEWVQSLILPARLQSLVGNLNFTFGPRTIYATMYNTNFVGSYAALMVPISMAYLLYSKTLKSTTFASVMLAMNMFVWFGSNARSGLMGIIVAFVLFGALWFFEMKKQWKKFAVLGGIFVAVLLVTDVASGGRISSQFSQLTPGGEGNITDLEREDIAYFEELNIDGFSSELITNKESIVINFNLSTSSLSFETLEGDSLTIESSENGLFTISDEGYEYYSFQFNPSTSSINVRAYQGRYTLYLTQEGFQMQGVGGLSSETINADRVKLLDGLERVASARGYIWSRSIPLLFFDTFFIGAGPDMYVITFPQRDFSGRLNGFTLTGINDKPHNMFLQIGVNVGVVALISLMVVYGFYLLDSIKIYWKRSFETIEEFMGLGIATGILAYLVAGIFNDQIVSVAPAFYALTGVGIAVNMMVKNLDKQVKEKAVN